MNWQVVQTALHKAVRGWIYDPNVRMIDFGWREQGGVIREGEACIRFHVEEKFASGPELESAQQAGMTRAEIPKSIAGVPVDVPQGIYGLQNWAWGRSVRRSSDARADRRNPMQGGISVANARLRGYGTLGGPVIDRETGARMILSNWHVLAGYWETRPGWPIYQPGRGDGGGGDDVVAVFSRDAMAHNLDAAVAELSGEREIVNNQVGLGRITGVGIGFPGLKVVKSGRRTGITHGFITGVEGTARMNYRGIDRLIRNVMTVEPRLGSEVSAGGDSGSLWLDAETNKAVGLHFAGSNHPERALAMDMAPILDALNVDMAVD